MQTVELGGIKYIERPEVQRFQVAVTTANQQIDTRFTFAGGDGHLLYGLGRFSLDASGVGVDRRFRFRYGNSDGNVWYVQPGAEERVTSSVLDTLIFGNGQFPFMVTPPIYYCPGSAILIQIEDVSGTIPYNIHFAFYTSVLIPV